MRVSGWAFGALLGVFSLGLFLYMSDRGDVTISSPDTTHAAAPAASCHVSPSPAPPSVPPTPSISPSSRPSCAAVGVASCPWLFHRYVSSPYELEWEGAAVGRGEARRQIAHCCVISLSSSAANVLTWKDGPCAAARTDEQKAKSKLWMEYASAINQRSWNDVELQSRRKDISAILSYFVYRRACDGTEFIMCDADMVVLGYCIHLQSLQSNNVLDRFFFHPFVWYLFIDIFLYLF